MKFSVLLEVLLIGLLLITPACNKQKKIINFEQKHQGVRLIDIPIPLGVKFLDNYFFDNSYAYFTNLKQQELISFYDEEMELEGWKKLTSFFGAESLIIFEKPNKHASISIRPQKNNSNLVLIFLMS